MSHEAVVKLRNARKMSLEVWLTSLPGMVMSMQSHLVVNVKFGGGVPRGELVDCDGGVEIRFLVGGASGWSVLTAVAIVTGRGGRGHCWKNDGIVFVEVPVVLFSFLFVTVVNG